MNKKQDALAPVFGALCFFLSAIEFVIPKPLPFLRIGLANVPLMLALDVLSFPAFLLLTMIKILGQAFISGTLFSYLVLFSAAGTMGAALTMYALRKLPRKAVSLVGISIAGAFVSNFIQLFIGRFFIFGEGIRYIAPPFLLIGTITSLLLGIFCESFKAESEWYAHTGCRCSHKYTITGRCKHCRSSVSPINNRGDFDGRASFYSRATSKSGYFLCWFDTLFGRKTKNTLDAALYFNARYCRMPSFYSDRERAGLTWQFSDHQWRATEWFGKSNSSPSDDFYFEVDAASAYPNSRIAWYDAG